MLRGIRVTESCIVSVTVRNSNDLNAEGMPLSESYIETLSQQVNA